MSEKGESNLKGALVNSTNCEWYNSQIAYGKIKQN